MLPILPALLLLILQGPSSIETMARDGRLPAALEAVSRQMEAQDHSKSSLEIADAAVLASLFGLGSDPALNKALMQLLSLDAYAVLEPAEPEPEEFGDRASPVLPDGTSPPLAEAFQTCRRTRDGPR